MGKYRIEITELAYKQMVLHYKSGNKKSIKSIEKILKELSETPFEGVGNPEPLKHNLAGFWSRRINNKDRIIYSVNENLVLVEVVSAMGHYSDK